MKKQAAAIAITAPMAVTIAREVTTSTIVGLSVKPKFETEVQAEPTSIIAAMKLTQATIRNPLMLTLFLLTVWLGISNCC